MSIAAGVLLAIAAVAVTLGILTDLYEMGDLPHKTWMVIRHNGPAGAITALYAEESGIPVLLPGDVFVVYMGRHAHGLTGWLVSWVVLIVAVVLGATNLYWISRRWGRRLLQGKAGKVMHLTPARLQKAEQWFERWGVWALIFGRHIPGFRIPITVASGTLEISYPKFAASVAVSSALWVGVFLYAGARYGRGIERQLLHHGRLYAVAIPLFLLFLLGSSALRHRLHNRAHPTPSRSA